MSQFEQSIRGLDPGEEVELFILDLNPMGINLIQHFTPSSQAGNSLWFGGNEYLPLPIAGTGFKKNSDDAPPEPELTIANVDKGGYALTQQYDDLLGAKVTRITTFSKFLDKLPDGSPNPDADSAAMFLPEIWYVEQKTKATPLFIQWKLRSVLDLNDKKIPSRLILKNFCQRTYRVWDADNNQWKYPLKRACPYTGTAKFDRNNSPVSDPAQDQCSLDVRGCAARFGNESLPGWFFPGVAKITR